MKRTSPKVGSKRQVDERKKCNRCLSDVTHVHTPTDVPEYTSCKSHHPNPNALIKPPNDLGTHTQASPPPPAPWLVSRGCTRATPQARALCAPDVA